MESSSVEKALGVQLTTSQQCILVAKLNDIARAALERALPGQRRWSFLSTLECWSQFWSPQRHLINYITQLLYALVSRQIYASCLNVTVKTQLAKQARLVTMGKKNNNLEPKFKYPE